MLRASTWEPAQAVRTTGQPSVPLQASHVSRCIISYEVMHTAGRSEPCSLSDLPSMTWMLLGRRWGNHFSSSSAQTRRKLAGTMINKGHSSCRETYCCWLCTPEACLTEIKHIMEGILYIFACSCIHRQIGRMQAWTICLTRLLLLPGTFECTHWPCMHTHAGISATSAQQPGNVPFC